MNKLKKTLRKTKGEAFKRQMNKERFRIKELFTGDVGDIFSSGKSVSEMSRQKINSTSFNGTLNASFGRSPRLVATEGQESKTRRNLRMNELRNTMRRSARRILCGRVVSVSHKHAHKQKINNTLPNLLMIGEKKGKIRRKIKMNKLREKASIISRVGSRENKTKRDRKMNNMTQTFMERIRRRIGVGRSLVFSSIKAEERFIERSLEGKAARDHTKREFGKRQTGRQFHVPQTARKVSVRKHENGLLDSSYLVNKSAVGLAGLSLLVKRMLCVHEAGL